MGERAFVTVQSLKKLERHLQDWATETKGWRIVQFDSTDNPKLSSEEYDLAELDPKVYADCLFCRKRWIKVGKKGKELEQRLIVTFSFKYREYLQYTREKQVARAQSIIDRAPPASTARAQTIPNALSRVRAARLTENWLSTTATHSIRR